MRDTAMMRWMLLALLSLTVGCIPPGGGGGGDDDGGPGGGDGQVDPDDGVPPDMAVDPDDGVPPDMFVDPDDGVPPPDMFVDPDDGVPPPDMAVDPVDGGCVADDELCNGVDDDCDGLVDEDFDDLGTPCLVGEGLCEVAGVVICDLAGGSTICDAVMEDGFDELCNGLDDDCDGEVDEAIEPQPCDTGVAGRCAGGLEQCVDGAPLCVPQLDPDDETCNGQDDDCDGLLDEQIPVEPCETGEPGRCSVGERLCEAGAPVCVGPGPAAEVCSMLDEDCDGAVDEGGVCDACADVECPPGFECDGGECVQVDPCAGVMCPDGTVCRGGRCVPDGPGDATPIGAPGETVVLEGSLLDADPDWARLDANCAGRRNGVYNYDALRIVNLTGAPRAITITATWQGGDGYLHLFDDGFDPASAEGCLAGNDDFNGVGDSQIREVVIGPGQVQVIVASTFSGNREIAGYVIEVETGLGAVDGEVCGNGLDDDGDGLIDCGDPDCAADPDCGALPDLVPGVQRNVLADQATIRGWRVCYTSAFWVSGDSVDALLEDCDGAQLMLACRPAGDERFTLAAEGLREDVLFDVGGGANVSHAANGVQWYYSPGRSWGFAPFGEMVNLSSCDTAATRPDERMCIHLDPGDVIDNGYRCGNNGLNDAADWQRLVLTR